MARNTVDRPKVAALLRAAAVLIEQSEGTGSVRDAVERAHRGLDDAVAREVDVWDDVLVGFARYLYEVVWTVLDALTVESCRRCVLCSGHRGGPIFQIPGSGVCPRGCKLCPPHAEVVVGQAPEEVPDGVIARWEGRVGDPAIVAGVMRAAADHIDRR